MELKYCKAEKINLNDFCNEKWLQDRIEDDTSILGLGELIIIERERKQSSGGRMDFLFLDPETQTMYETEIMLGATDESHIIRTIEYWDIERRRYPSKDHKAVLVAEEITNRFFNVIGLLNRSVPIIAIQLNALKLNENIILDFTKVLDIYEPPEDEEELVAEAVDRAYWENRSNSKSISIMDDIIEIVKKAYPDGRITYNKSHVALGTKKRNFIWFHPRKKEGYCHFNLRVGQENFDYAKELLEEVGIPFNVLKKDRLAIMLQRDDLKENNDKITEMVLKVLELYS
jgi:hypothetical protein